MKLQFSRQIFEKLSNIKFHENPSLGAEFFHANMQTYGEEEEQTDRHDKANNLFIILPMRLSRNKMDLPVNSLYVIADLKTTHVIQMAYNVQDSGVNPHTRPCWLLNCKRALPSCLHRHSACVTMRQPLTSSSLEHSVLLSWVLRPCNPNPAFA